MSDKEEILAILNDKSISLGRNISPEKRIELLKPFWEYSIKFAKEILKEDRKIREIKNQ